MAIRDCVLAVGAGVFDSRGRLSPTPGTGAAYNLLGFYRALDGLRVRRGQASPVLTRNDGRKSVPRLQLAETIPGLAVEAHELHLVDRNVVAD